ncbi:MAG: YdcF family protein, partial [Pyramidobacter sp.]|nr:YdcF family protein [Pyramidobacter sp.]
MTQAAYFFSTLLTALLSPLGLFLGANVLTMTVPLSWLKKRRRGIALLLTLLFAFACTDFCGKTLLSFLEHLAERQPALNGQKSVVFVVLGGGAVAEGDIYQPSISSQRRLRRARKLADERRGSTLMLSGIEAPVMARWLGDTPFLMEPYSLNTRENVRESAKLLRRLYPDEKARPAVCLVT